MHHVKSDLGSLILIQITLTERTLNVSLLQSTHTCMCKSVVAEVCCAIVAMGTIVLCLVQDTFL